MTPLKGKHLTAEIEGIRCTVVETGLTEGRKEFLAGLLRRNGFDVKSEHEKAKDGTPLETWILGVTDLLFNPIITIYEQKLFREDGFPVTPAFWEQKETGTEIPYWQVPH
jgi:hypothetical protein